MVPKSAYPPTYQHAHLTKTISPSTAQAQLAAFLSKTTSNAYLHPDALLSTSGISFSASSGPNGGLAIHHLKRIEAGLRGENLVAETAAELEEQFGDEAHLPKGDDTRLDELIEERKSPGGLKRKRSTEEVAQWAEESSEAAFGERATLGGAEGREWEGAEDLEEYELKQRPMKGELGEREGASAVMQGGVEPAVVEHDGTGAVMSKKPKTEADKKARKDAKKARRKAERKQGGAAAAGEEG